MTNTEQWEAVAARGRPNPAPAYDAVLYGPGGPSDAQLRLLGEVTGHRVLDLGAGTGQAAIAMARAGAHAIAVDAAGGMLALGRQLALETEARVEWHHGDLADLAFLRAESIDLAFSADALAEVPDLDRVFRQVHRVLRPGGHFVFSVPHPVSLCTGRVGDDTPGGLPLGNLEIRRSWSDPTPVTVARDGVEVRLHPRTIEQIHTGLRRAGYAIEVILEPDPPAPEPGPVVPHLVVWRARKLGV